MPEDSAYRVVVVGAGFGGLGMAVALEQAGIEDFLIVDKGDGLGGTWRDNTYPGAACDVPSRLYSFSSRPGHWSRRFPPQQEILRYLQSLSAEHGLGSRLRLRSGATSAEFDERSADCWREGAEAYLGISVSGFPNFFMLYGPNTNLGGNSIIYMLEGQIGYVACALRALDTEGLDWIDVRPEVQRSFNTWVGAARRTTVWESGCRSWYTTASGRNTNNWPDHTFLYRYRVRRFDLARYRVMPKRPAAVAGGQPRMTARNGDAAGLLSRVTPSRATAVRLPPGLMRPCVRQIGRRVLDPALPWEVQRRRLEQVARSTPVPRGTKVAGRVLNGVRAEVVTAGGVRPQRTVLHLHGGGYCIGSPRMMRTWAAHLSARAACSVVVPDYSRS